MTRRSSSGLRLACGEKRRRYDATRRRGHQEQGIARISLRSSAANHHWLGRISRAQSAHGELGSGWSRTRKTLRERHRSSFRKTSVRRGTTRKRRRRREEMAARLAALQRDFRPKVRSSSGRMKAICRPTGRNRAVGDAAGAAVTGWQATRFVAAVLNAHPEDAGCWAARPTTSSVNTRAGFVISTKISGNYVYYACANGMTAIMNGLTVHGSYRPYGGVPGVLRLRAQRGACGDHALPDYAGVRTTPSVSAKTARLISPLHLASFAPCRTCTSGVLAMRSSRRCRGLRHWAKNGPTRSSSRARASPSRRARPAVSCAAQGGYVLIDNGPRAS